MNQNIDTKLLGEKIQAAVGHRIETYRLIDEMRQMIVGDDALENEQVKTENFVADFVDDWAADSETAEGFGEADAAAMLEDLAGPEAVIDGEGQKEPEAAA